jgi:ATP-dependent Clp protease ATP-binding subunit ClpA
MAIASWRGKESAVFANELDLPAGTVSDAAQRMIDRAAAEARRRGHGEVLSAHLFFGFVQTEWTLFDAVMRDAGANSHAVALANEEALATLPSIEGIQPSASDATRFLARLALDRASRAARVIQPADLFVAILEESNGIPATMLRQFEVLPEVLAPRVIERIAPAAPAGPTAQPDEVLKRLALPLHLDRFGINLNLLAREDKLAPVHGRAYEIDQMLEILSHRDRTNSVMLLGEAGVGKTAVVEGLARRLELEPETVPARLRDCQIVSLQMSGLVAGSMLRGMFEERVQRVIAEIRERPNLILFIDEAHTMVGAGASLGSAADAGDILKPVLARGDLRIIAATTRGEFKEHFEEDEALARRFVCVDVPEPSLDETRGILLRRRPRLESNYHVRILDEAIDTALEMSPRYMRHLHLPDKAIGWLDTAAVRVEMQGRSEVGAADVEWVISDAARVPVDMVSRDVTGRFGDLERRLARRVVGQHEAVTAVADRLILNKGPLKDGFDRPDGVLLFVGPTGVGKSELAKAIAAVLFGDEKKMVRLDMSEYQDSRTAIDKLIGMPRGIVGSPRGGVLTNQLKDNPCTVLLLDEVEKASPEVLNLFLQAFDEGWITDGRGRRVHLSDSLVIMTSNVGSECYRKLRTPLGFLSAEGALPQVKADIRRDVERRFTPEFLNRIDEVVLFSPLTRDGAREIAVRYLAQITAVMARSGKILHIDDDALELLIGHGYSPEFGARFLKRSIDQRVKLPISRRWRMETRFHVCVQDGRVLIGPQSPG